MSAAAEAGYLYVSASGSTYESLRRIEILARDWVADGDYAAGVQIALAVSQGAPKLTHALELDIEAAADGRSDLHQLACRWGYSYLGIDDMLDLSRWRSWREDDAPLRVAVALARRQREGTRIAERLRASAAAAEREFRNVCRTIEASHSRDGSRRVRVFRACVEACRLCFPLKDDRDLVSSHAQSALRWVLLEVGRRLAREGTVDDEQSVFLFEPAEIVAYLSVGRPPPEAMWRLAGDRRREQARLARYTLPAGVPESEEPTDAGGDVLRGEPASPGRVEGRARIAEDVGGVEALQPGEILCLKGEKRVGWTVFFPTIGGLVYEKGNWLCHESNLCRELGIPAVVCLGKAIETIRDGEILRIDGRAGTVCRAGGP
jgi:pyruvate,water dikinase